MLLGHVTLQSDEGSVAARADAGFGALAELCDLTFLCDKLSLGRFAHTALVGDLIVFLRQLLFQLIALSAQ